MGVSSTAAGSTESVVGNPLRGRWTRLTEAVAGATAGLWGATGALLAAFEPRLLTAPELLPPDESLVAAWVPAAVLLAVSAVLAARLRRIPSMVSVSPVGVGFRRGPTGREERYPWPALRIVAAPPLWEGVRVDAVGPGGRRRSYWIDGPLAERLRLSVRARSAPNRPPDPER